MFNFLGLKKRKKPSFMNVGISPDEIFLDSENMPNFDPRQFEGRMELLIGPRIFLFLGVGFVFLGIFLLLRVGYLQIIKGEQFFARAQENHLRLFSLASERGLIYDRTGELLAWNAPSFYLVLEKEAFMDKNLKQSLEDFLKFLKKDKWESEMEKSVAQNQDLILGTYEKWQEVNDIYQDWSFLPLRIEPVSSRSYKELGGLGHILGYLGYLSEDDLKKYPFAVYENTIGKAGVEKSYENILRGESGLKIIEVDSMNKIQSESIQKYSQPGGNIHLSIDARIQNKFYEIFSNISAERGFNAAGGVILDIKNGQVLSLVSYPEYDSGVLSRGVEKEIIQNYFQDPKKPFINRAIAGLYAPGSIIKPFVAVAALNEKIISPEKQIFSSGSISIPNPYDAHKESVFYDWKAHGWVDMRRALAVSSNVYFYEVGGGYGDIGGLGIKRIGDYMRLFGLGSKTGIKLETEAVGMIPSPELKEKNASDPVWRVGDTYNASIGQGDFQVTPLQMAVAVASIANNGRVVKPLLVLDETEEFKNLSIPQEYFEVVKEGMRQSALEGTVRALGDLKVKIAAKTGTAEIGFAKSFVNSWLIAFWPYDNPRFALSIVLERGSASNLIGSVYVARQLFEWMTIYTPEYLTNKE